MIRINLLRQQPNPVTEGERLIVARMIEEAYHLGMIAGETRAYWKVIHILDAEKIRFNSLTHQSKNLG